MKTILYLLFFAVFAVAGCTTAQVDPYVTVKGQQFLVEGKPYYYIGANYWYGGLVPNDAAGKQRIIKELDFLVAKGVNNLRVLVGAEGEGQIHGVKRVEPSLQSRKGVFNEDALKGLDFLLSEMGKRNMKAIVFLSNNWEWSGGFLQYLNWNGLIEDSVLKRKLSWDEMRDYVSRFYSCDPCKKDYYKQVELVVKRVNSITGKEYAHDEAIMAWELANEPRPMRPVADSDYKQWISEAAALIKAIDHHHLVTIGSEGEMGTESIDLFSAVHQDKNIDYATIHIWPKNWSWFSDTAIAKSLDKVISNTNTYIEKHVAAARKFEKPLVIEEFGLPRDEQSFSLAGTTYSRDKYYSFIFNVLASSVAKKDIIAGANFWAFGGIGRPSLKNGVWWQKGDDWVGDPPMEEQGLNTVFDSDTSTWNMIDSFAKRINQHTVK
jgi:mannan endo-1,4-beta-mannosidase